MEKKIAKDVFTITETKDDSKKDIWTNVGVAFPNLCCAQHKLGYVVSAVMWRSVDIPS